MISLFFLGFPGLVTSIGLIVLYHKEEAAGFNNARLRQISGPKVAVYALVLLIFYPVLPTALYVIN